MSASQHYSPIFYESHRLDSWDLENLRYIRKKSENQAGLLLEEYSIPEDELSLEQEQDEEDHLHKKSGPWEVHDQNYSAHATEYFNHEDYQQWTLETRHTPENEEDATVYSEDAEVLIRGKASMENTNNVEALLPEEEDELEMNSLCDPTRNRLDDCYLLDVLTIGNDSVLKDIGGNSDKSEDSRSKSPVDASKMCPPESFSNTPIFVSRSRQRQPLRKISAGVGRGSLGTPSNSPSTSSASSGDDHDAECDYLLASNSASSYSSRVDERDLDCFQSDISSPNSCSPYLNLGRDLPMPSLYMTPPPPNTPTRFGVDKKGHLVIDYSHNWNGLELYIKQLHLG